MKRFLCLICALCMLIAFTGCGFQQVTGAAEDTLYSLEWKSQLDGAYLLTFDAGIPEGYSWSGSSGGIVRVFAPKINQKDGTTSFKVKAMQLGDDTAEFSLTDSTGRYCAYTFTVYFSVDNVGVLTVTYWTAEEGDTVETLGQGNNTVTGITSPQMLRLVLSGTDWNYSHTNPAFTTEIVYNEFDTVLMVYREDRATFEGKLYEQSLNGETLSIGEGENKTEYSDFDEAIDAYYAAKTDMLTISGKSENTSYVLFLNMDTEGRVTVVDYEQNAYAGQQAEKDVQIFYDEFTGETRVVSDGYSGWLPEDAQGVEIIVIPEGTDPEAYPEEYYATGGNPKSATEKQSDVQFDGQTEKQAGQQDPEQQSNIAQEQKSTDEVGQEVRP